MANRCVISVSLTPAVYMALEDYCKNYDVSKSKLVNVILKEFFKAVESKEQGKEE